MWSYFRIIIIQKLLSESGANFLEAVFKLIKFYIFYLHFFSASERYVSHSVIVKGKY